MGRRRDLSAKATIRLQRLASKPDVRWADLEAAFTSHSRRELAEIICARAEVQPYIPQSQRRRAEAAGRHLQ